MPVLYLYLRYPYPHHMVSRFRVRPCGALHPTGFYSLCVC